ncbi:hypothetical protein Afil01_54150 [Actinorhabdospora filicis]|uniref:Peptidoglycan binding-like domain-containing protein n=1 Tax=Actinorhabdospora filicis TaxID=1785913 RepID=A0A9W6SR79_9ACTN|nr:peptidoglycan-binding protein [Actinorhabdospora filicis]GLZ80608.1 hypothetical protein Afil01_54150 [Actinorhabdospora filicis]
MHAKAAHTRQATPLADPKRPVDSRREHPLLGLQRAAGNIAVSRLVESATKGKTALRSPRFSGVARLEACAAGRDRLRQGDRGDAVKRVQQALTDLNRGYDLGEPDGAFGGKTAAVVRRFKADEKLGATTAGDVGPGTMKRLDELFAATGPTPLPGPVPTTAPPTKLPTTDLRGTLRLVKLEQPRPLLGGFRGEFGLEADIDPGPRQRFAEYRQFIKGTMVAGPTAKTMRDTKLGAGAGDLMSPTVFKEDTDGNPVGGYGHRGRILPFLDEYSKPDRATGTHYRNEDLPGFPGPIVTAHCEIDLVFQGMLVDTRADHPGEPETPIAGTAQTWTVKGAFHPTP